MTSSDARAQPSDAWFLTTHWSVVLAARGPSSARTAEALETLCRTYWYPLYAYVRRQGNSPADAQDLTQEFFARLLEKDYLQAVDRERGKFRSFLLMAFKRFLANEWDRARAQKRGGGQPPVPCDTELAESRYLAEQSLPAERLFDRRWALTLLDRAMARLREEIERSGKPGEFDRIKNFLTAEKGTISYAEEAAARGMTEGALRVAVHRLRKRFREVFREEIAHTVPHPDEIEDEVRYLLSVLAD